MIANNCLLLLQSIKNQLHSKFLLSSFDKVHYILSLQVICNIHYGWL